MTNDYAGVRVAIGAEADDADPMDVDLRLDADADLLVRRVAVAPPGLQPFGQSLVELACLDDRPRFGQAIQDCLSTRTSQHLTILLEASRSIAMTVRLSHRRSSDEVPLRLTGLINGEGRLPGLDAVERPTIDEEPGFNGGSAVDQAELARTLLDVIPSAVFVKDTDARFIAANRSLLDSFGAESWHDVQGKNDFDFHPHAEAEVYAAIDRQIIRTGEPVHDLEESQTRHDGRVEIVRTTKLPMRDRLGKVIGLMGFSTDVTEPRRVSEALALSELRHLLATRASRDGIWDYDVASGEFYVAPRCAQLLGIAVMKDQVTWTQMTANMGADDALALAADFDMLVRDRSQSFSREVAIDEGDGPVRWLSIVGAAHVVDGRVERLAGSAADITDDHERKERLIHQARHDDLTGLTNRRALIEAMHNSPGALIYLDLDSFKDVNDSLGHQAGDRMLVAVADRLRAVVGPDAVLCRFGGDEFAVLLGSDSQDVALATARTLQRAIGSSFMISGLEIYTTASIGIVGGEAAHEPAVDVLRDVDIALYEAKERGKAQAVLFEPAMRMRAEQRLDLQMRLRRAVDEMEFALHYQPIVTASDRTLEGVEALLRWVPADGSCESPASFLPYLEESGLIVPVGEWVIDEACRQMAAWQSEFPEMHNVRINLNISRVQLSSRNLENAIRTAISRYGIEPSRMTIEVTETAIAQWSSHLRDRLARLRELGILVAIDDFGVGQSSLSALHDLPVDILKIDRSFTERIVPGGEEPVTNAVLKLASALNLGTVAEGIESDHQAEWLAKHNCACLQGYLLSEPLSPREFPNFLLRR